MHALTSGRLTTWEVWPRLLGPASQPQSCWGHTLLCRVVTGIQPRGMFGDNMPCQALTSLPQILGCKSPQRITVPSS